MPVDSQEIISHIYSRTGIILRALSFANVGSPSAHIVPDQAYFKELASQALSPMTVVVTHIILSRIRSINKNEVTDTRLLYQYLKQYDEQLYAYLRIAGKVVNGIHSVSSHRFNPARGIATEAFFYGLFKTLKFPIEITNVIDDRKGRDFLLDTVFVDVSSSTVPERINEKISHSARDQKLLLIIPSIAGFAMQDENKAAVFATAMKRMLKQKKNITLSDVAYGRIEGHLDYIFPHHPNGRNSPQEYALELLDILWDINNEIIIDMRDRYKAYVEKLKLEIEREKKVNKISF